MGETITQLRLRWNLLQIITWGLPVATFIPILEAIPSGWWVATVPILILGAIATSLAIIQWKLVWIWLVLIAQGFLFAVGLIAAVSGATNADIQILVLAFPMILASEHVLTTVSKYSHQSSIKRGGLVDEFNSPALVASLNHLYMDLGRDSIIFGGAILLSIAVGIESATGLNAPLLSDPSLYAIVASLSLALLIVSRER